MVVIEVLLAFSQIGEWSPDWFASWFGGWVGIFVVLLIAVCRLAQMRIKAGWIVFLRATWITFLLFWVVRPLLQVWLPDVLELDGGVFTDFAIVFGSLAVLATLFYTMVIPLFFSSMLEDLWKWIPVFDLSPKKGKTVKELKDGIDLPPREMLFGGADRELVEHWQGVGRTMLVVSAARRKVFVVAVAVLAVWPVFIYFVAGGSQGAFERDVVRMWEVEPRIGAEGKDAAGERVLAKAKDFFYRELKRSGMSDEVAQAKVEEAAKVWRGVQVRERTSKVDDTVVPTQRALNAAKRVFQNELAFRGLTRLDARRLLGVERKDDRYLLDKPEYSWQAEQVLLRMDNGFDSVSLLAGYDDEGRIRITWCQDERGQVPSLGVVMAAEELLNEKAPKSGDSGAEVR